jgi:hypothetical protein
MMGKTDKEVLANRPDRIIKKTKEKICIFTLVDVATYSVRNVIEKRLEK